MRKLLVIILASMPFVCLAGGDSKQILVPQASSNAVKAVTSTHKFTGYLESIYIDVTAPATQTVVVATSTTTLLTATAITADDLYPVRYPAVDASGASVAGVTNLPHLLVQEPITVTVTSTQATAVDVGVLVKTYNVK